MYTYIMYVWTLFPLTFNALPVPLHINLRNFPHCTKDIYAIANPGTYVSFGPHGMYDTYRPPAVCSRELTERQWNPT